MHVASTISAVGQRCQPRMKLSTLAALLLAAPASSLVASPRNLRLHETRRSAAVTARLTAADTASRPKLPPELTPITLGVFSQMLGEGIAMSSLPLYLTRLGAAPITVGIGISCFSVSQMTFAPIMVGLSSKIGRSLVLRLCLAGAAASSLLIAFSGSVYGVVAGRALAGIFAACVPVAQSGVTDILPRDQAALGLSRVSAASQLGIVVGPAASALLQAAFVALGLPAERCLPAVFVCAAAFALSVLAQMTILERRYSHREAAAAEPPEEKEQHLATTTDAASNAKVSDEAEPAAPPADEPAEGEADGALRLAQPMLRTVTIVVGWTAVLSNSIYGLFAPRFMGFAQPQLSATYSAAAALMIATQAIFPALVKRIGEHRACTLGILAAGAGIGGQSLLRVQPYHSLLYMANRVGAAVSDTATATLVARSSVGREARSRNLALLTSSRAAARIASPLLSSRLFELSCRGAVAPWVAPGALPFVSAAALAMAVAPLPMVLRGAEERHKRA